LFDACIGCLGWWFFGFAFAFGEVNGGFIGYNKYFFATNGLENFAEDWYLSWVFHFAFAATSATIVAGALAERCQLNTYILFSFLQTSFVYPVCVAWNWGGGWLYVRGFQDFAGSCTIHVVGGAAALWGALILGERYGKAK
jgi:Amt family ammonium transporter